MTKKSCRMGESRRFYLIVALTKVYVSVCIDIMINRIRETRVDENTPSTIPKMRTSVTNPFVYTPFQAVIVCKITPFQAIMQFLSQISENREDKYV